MLFKGNILDLTAFTDKSRRLQNFRKLGANNPYNDGLSGFSTTTSWTINDAIEVTNVGGSVAFDGSGDYLYINSSSDFDLESGAYTLEFWVWFNSRVPGTRTVVLEGSTKTVGIIATGTGNNDLYVNEFGTANVIVATGVLAGKDNQWLHIAVSSDGTTRRLFLDGSVVASTTNSLFDSGNNSVGVGGNIVRYSGANLNGYISNLRVVKGTALYTSNFTPPAEPLKRISGTSLLTCQGSAITDASLNNFTITANGNAAATSSVGPFGYYAVGISTGLYRTFNNVDNLELRNVPLVGSSNITLVDKKNNRYFAGTNDGFLYSSTDGETWTDVSGGLRTNALINWGNTNATSRIWSIEYGQGYYVVSGINRLAYSTDLSTWSDARIGRDFYGNVGLTSRSRNNSFVDWQRNDYNYKIYYHPETSKWYLATLGNIGFTTNITDPSSWRQVANSDFYNIFNEYADQTPSVLSAWSYQYGPQAGIALTDRIVTMKGWGGYTQQYHTPVAFSTSTTFSTTSGRGMQWSEFKTPSFGPVGIKTIFAGYTPNHISQGPNNQKIITAAYSSANRISRVAITTDFVSYTNLGHGGIARDVGFGYTSAMVSGSQDANTATFQKPDMAVLYTSYMRGGNNNYYDYYSAYSSAYKSGNNKWVIAYDWGGVTAYTHNSVAISTDGGTSWKGALHETENSIYSNYTSHVYSGVGSTDYFILGKYNSTDGAYVEVSQDGEEWYSTGIGNSLSPLKTSGARYLVSGIVTNGYYFSGYDNGRLFITNNPVAVLDRETIPVNPNNSLEPDNLVLCLPLNTARGVSDISGIMTSYTGTNKTVTNNNSVGIATTVSKYYGSSASFNGTNQYLSIADSPDLQMGSGDFTIEFWIYLNSLSGNPTPIDKAYTGSGVSNTGYLLQYSSSALKFYGGITLTSSTTDTTGVWIHYALTRNSGTTTLYRNGVSVASGSDATNYTYNTTLGIGANVLAGAGFGAGAGAINGYMSDVRIYKGYAKYTANFTPPRLADYYQYLTFSAPLNTENPSVSLTYVNTFELSAGIGTTATTLTNTAVSIATSATNSIGVATYLHGINAGIGSTVISTSFYTNAGSATTVGINTFKFGTSSVRFTGVSNSRLSGPTVGFGTTDFTISFFFRAQGAGQNSYNPPYEQRPGGDGAYPLIYSASNGPMRYYANSADRITGTTNMTVASGWHHICVQRNSGITRLFVNGTQEGSSYTDTTNYLPSQITLGDLVQSNSYNMNANLDDLVVWNGIANYAIGAGNTIQVPQSQYNINTDPNKNYVVLSSTFEDTPVGTSNISYTGVGQRGIALFNGTTSAITGTATTAFYFGTGDYTIECFYYKNATDSSGNEYLFDGRVDNNTRIRPLLHSLQASGGPLAFYLNGAYRIYGQNIGGSANSSNTSLGITTSPAVDLQGRSNLNKWNHVALCRKDRITRLYVNGKIQGVYADTNSYDGPGMRIGNYWNGSNAFNGYIQDFQVYKGYAKYYPTGIGNTSEWKEILNSSTLGPSWTTNAVKGIATRKINNVNHTLIVGGSMVGLATYTNENDLIVGSASSTFQSYPMYVNGSAYISTSQYVYGSSSLYFPGIFDQLVANVYGGASNGGLIYGSGDFQFEFWMYPQGQGIMFSSGGSYNGAYTPEFSWGGGTLKLQARGSFIDFTGIATNTWTHVAIARSSGVFKTFIGGIERYSVADTYNYSSGPSWIGNDSRLSGGSGWSYFQGYYKGYIQDIRFFRGPGSVGYTTNFTPPSQPLSLFSSGITTNVGYLIPCQGEDRSKILPVVGFATTASSFVDIRGAMASNMYTQSDSFGNGVSLPALWTNLLQAHVFENKFVVIGDYGFIGISSNGSNWSQASRRGYSATNTYTPNVGIRSYYLAGSTYFYDIVGVGSTVVVTGEYSAPSYLHTFFSNNGGEDEFANLWHGSSLELYQQGLSGSPTISWTGGTSIGFSTTTNELLLANSYGTYRNYGDSAINYASGIPTTGINTNTHNWVDFTLNVRSLVERSGKITKVKNADNKWYIIGYDATANNSRYQLGITTSLSSINDSMKLVRVGYKQFTDVASAGGDNFVAISSQFPQRNSLANDIITISGIKTSYTTTQTQNQYFSDPSITGTGATDRVVTGVTSIPAGSYALRNAPTASTAAFKYGTKSWYFTNNAAFTDSQLDFNFNTGDFQIEFWFNPQSSGGGTYIIMPIDQNYAIQYSSTSLNWIGSGGTRTIQTGITTNAWYHVAVARQGGVTRTFWNGTQTGSYSDVIDYRSNSTYGRTFGARADGYSPGASNYYLDDIRIYTGYCGYTTNFTAPTSQLTITGSARPEKISFFSNCEDDNYTKMVDSYYVTGRDYVTNLNNYYPRLTNASADTYTWNTTVEGYFKPDVAGIHTFSLYSLYNTVLSFDGKAVTSTNYNTTRRYTTPSLSTSTYYPIKIVTDAIGYSYPLQFTYQNSANSTFTGDFSRTGFATAGVGTVGFNVFDVPYFSNGDTTFVGYRHKAIRGVLKGDNSYVYFGDRGFVGYSTNNINIRNFREEGYRGIEFNPVGVGKSINDIFGTNLINCGIYTSGYYALGGNSNPPKLGISTNGLDWNNKSTFVSDALSGNTATTFNALGITSSNKVILSMGTNSVAITTDFVTVSASVYNPGVAATSLFTNGGAVGAAISTGVSKWGNGSLWIKPNANTSSYVEASFTNVVSGDYTMEWWQRQTGTQYGYYGTMEWGVYSNSILNTGSGGWYLSGGSGGVSGSGAGWSNTANTWEHYALVRNGSTVTMYKDGVGTVLTTSGSGTFDPTTDTFRIGAPQWAGGNWAGNMNDYVFYNGLAKYTSNFTPPSAQYDITTDPYNGFVMFAAPFTGTVDGATGIIYYTGIVGTAKTAFAGITTTITAVGGIGTVNVLGDSKGKLYVTDDTLSGITSVGFSTTTPTTSTFDIVRGNVVISTASSAYGGSSAFFDGTGDSLTVSTNPLTGNANNDFTVEGWFNASGNGNYYVISAGAYNNGYADIIIYRTSGIWYFYSSSNGSSYNVANAQSFGTVANGTWVHLAVERKGNTFRMYRNGVGVNTITSSASYPAGSRPLYVSTYDGTNGSYFGYIQDFRMYDRAKYNSSASGIGNTFTPPTSFVTALNDTQPPLLAAPFSSTYGLNYYESNVYHKSYFGGNPIKKFIKTDQYLIGIATGGYVGYSTNGTSWSVSSGFNGNVTGVAYNGISTDPKYTIVNENGEIYMSGIN